MTGSRGAIPLAVAVIAGLYIAVGGAGVALHLGALLGRQPDAGWIELTESLGLLCGVFLLRGHNWARWLAVAWIGFHVVLTALNAFHQFAIHALLLAGIGWLLFRPEAARFFRGARGAG